MKQDALLESMNAEALQALYAKTAYMLRESRKEVLRRHAVASESDLLRKIKNGEVGEHPAYDHYLSALILEQMRMQVRVEMMEQIGAAPAPAPAPFDACLHPIFKEELERNYGHRLAEPVRLAQDALTLSFDTGLMMETRYFSNEEYSINWSWGEAELRIDTAPVPRAGTAFEAHLHNRNETVRAWPIADPGLDGWGNFSSLLDVLLLDPLLERVKPL